MPEDHPIIWAEIHKVITEVSTLRDRVALAEAQDRLMNERVGTLIKFVDRLATVVYTSAGGLFVTIVGTAILTKGA